MPGRPTWPVISASAIRQRELSVPWVCWEMPMPQKIIERLGLGVGARHVAQDRRIDAADRRHRLRREVLDLASSAPRSRDVGLDVLLVVELLLDDGVQQRVQHGDVAAGLNAANRWRGASGPGRADP